MIGRRFSKPSREKHSPCLKSLSTPEARLQIVLQPFLSVFKCPIKIDRSAWTPVAGTDETEAVGRLPLAAENTGSAPFRFVITQPQFRFVYDNAPLPSDEASSQVRVPAVITFIDGDSSQDDQEDYQNYQDHQDHQDHQVHHDDSEESFSTSSVVVLGALVAGLSLLFTSKPNSIFR